jgi:RNA polymerase sigma-70 factor, ECF subfamily
MHATLTAARNEMTDRTAHRGVDSDGDVIDLVHRGDLDGAIQRLMQRYGAAVLRYGCSALNDAALAEDVQQQVFIQTHRDLRRFRGGSTLRVWLFRIARNRVLDAARHRRREQRRHMADAIANDPVDPSPLPGERLDDARLRVALVAALAELPDKIRIAVLLRYQQGFTFQEMSVICRKKPGTLAVRVARALPVLRARIETRLGYSL